MQRKWEGKTGEIQERDDQQRSKFDKEASTVRT